MAIADDLKAVVEELFQEFGSDVTITTPGSESRNDFGEVVTSGDTTRSAQAILDAYNRFAIYPNEGQSKGNADVNFIIKGTETLNDGDFITYGSKKYQISNIQPVPVTNVDIVYQVEGFEQ
jgi:hypothetical protein